MVDLCNQLAQEYLNPMDKLIGLIGLAGSGKSMLIKGMFPGLELTNDDDGVNVRPLPLLDVSEEQTGFYSTHTYHLDIHFEAAFTQMHVLAESILTAIHLGKRVVVEHFDMVYPHLNGRNAGLLIGIGEEVIITRPTIFGPEPQDIADIVFKSQPIRKMTHTAEDLCEYIMRKHGMNDECIHSDVRHGFIFSFEEKPELAVSLEQIEQEVKEMIARDIPISFHDDLHIKIADELWLCHGPRMHVRTTGDIKGFTLNKEFILDPKTHRFLLVGMVGEQGAQRLNDLNKIG
jgi:hypothetical protein